MSELQGKRILTYLRVSTEEQARNGESIADQRQALRKWAEQNGCVIVHEFADEGFSARKPYRSRPARRLHYVSMGQAPTGSSPEMPENNRRKGQCRNT